MVNEILTRAGHAGINYEGADLKFLLREEVLDDAKEMFADITGDGKVEKLALFPDSQDFTLTLTVDATAPTRLLIVDMDFMRRAISTILDQAGVGALKAGALIGMFVAYQADHGTDIDATVHNDTTMNIVVDDTVKTYVEGLIPEVLHFCTANKFAVLQRGGAGSAGLPTHSQRQVVALNNPLVLASTSAKFVEAGGFAVIQKSNGTSYTNGQAQTIHAKVTWVVRPLADKDEKFAYNPDAFKRFLCKI